MDRTPTSCARNCIVPAALPPLAGGVASAAGAPVQPTAQAERVCPLRTTSAREWQRGHGEGKAAPRDAADLDGGPGGVDDGWLECGYGCGFGLGNVVPQDTGWVLPGPGGVGGRPASPRDALLPHLDVLPGSGVD